MIKKLNLIRNTGKFYNHSNNSNDISFDINTIIYANNGYGKTTISTIIKSLFNQDTNLLISKKTLGSSNSQEICLNIDGSNYQFHNGNWQTPLPHDINVFIFDDEYISHNILTEDITHDNKKALHRVLIGKEGIELHSDLVKLIKSEKQQKDILRKFDKDYQLKKISISLNDYVDYNKNHSKEELQKLVSNLDSDITKKSQHNQIKVLKIPNKILFTNFDFEKLKEVFLKSPDTVQKEAENKVLEHLKENIKINENSAEFIKMGYQLIKERNNCPFCGQSLDSVHDLIASYNKYYFEAQTDLQNEINDLLSEYNEWNISSILSKINDDMESAKSCSYSWKNHLKEDLSTIIKFEIDFIKDINNLKKNVYNDLSKKQKDLNYTITFNNIELLQNQLDRVSLQINTVNTYIEDYNKKIATYKSSIPAQDLSFLQIEQKKNTSLLIRFSEEEVSWCKSYQVENAKLSSIEKNKQVLEEELNIYNKKLFSDYEKRINDILIDLGADFQICKIESKVSGSSNEPYLSFHLKILNCVVPLQQKQLDKPCFKNTLSAGDKGSLAFAFFFAYLERQDNLERTIIIFDDPLSSLDQFRKLSTAEYLSNLTKSIILNQVIILTHNRDFLHLLDKKVVNPKFLTIKSDITNGSRLDLFNIKEDCKNEFHKIIDYLKNYQMYDNGLSSLIVQGEIRRAFEFLIKFKYYNDITDSTFGKILNQLFDRGYLLNIKSDLYNLLDISEPPHHGEIDYNPLRELDRDNLLPKISKTFTLLKQV